MNTYIIFNGYKDLYMEVETELPSESYKIGTTFDDYLQGDTFVKLSDEQVAFRTANPTAGIKEVWDMKLNTPTDEEKLEQAKNLKLVEIDNADLATNGFYVGTTKMWLNKADRTALISNTIPALEANGKTSTNLWGKSDGMPIPFDIPITSLKQMLETLELYAKATYDTTMEHKAAVLAMTKIEDVEAFNATAGYPNKLTFNI